jgi:cytochrome P450
VCAISLAEVLPRGYGQVEEEMTLRSQLPPGPREPAVLQTIGWWARPVAYMERARARYGKRFTIRLLASPPFVVHSEPEHMREIFAAPPDVLHPGEGARILEPVVGAKSLILLDEGEHLEQRKLMTPAFHGEKMARLSGLMADVAEREIAGWSRDQATRLHPLFQGLTMEIILRAVFGLDPGQRLTELRGLLTAILDFSSKPASVIPQLQRGYFGRGPWIRFAQMRERADQLLYDLIDERRGDEGDRDDILALLLSARHEDGSPMTDTELRDELMTLLVAGHETTASELAWVFERLAREPTVLDRLVSEIDADDGDAYLTATIQETLRRSPVLPNAEPRLVKKTVEIGGWQYPQGACLIASAYLLHHDPDVYPEPYAFRPERFLDESPGTFTWIPFGGGRRRCIGASFATLEMKIVLRAVLSANSIAPAPNGAELTRRRSITLSPKHGAPTVLRERDPVRAPDPGEPATAGVSAD